MKRHISAFAVGSSRSNRDSDGGRFEFSHIIHAFLSTYILRIELITGYHHREYDLSITISKKLTARYFITNEG